PGTPWAVCHRHPLSDLLVERIPVRFDSGAGRCRYHSRLSLWLLGVDEHRMGRIHGSRHFGRSAHYDLHSSSAAPSGARPNLRRGEVVRCRASNFTAFARPTPTAPRRSWISTW